jgi:hypothetical protein
MQSYIMLTHEISQHEYIASRIGGYKPATTIAAAAHGVKPTPAAQSKIVKEKSPEERWAILKEMIDAKASITSLSEEGAAAGGIPDKENGQVIRVPSIAKEADEAEAALDAAKASAVINNAAESSPAPAQEIEVPIVDHAIIADIAQDIIDGKNGTKTQREYFSKQTGIPAADLGNSADSSSLLHKLVNKIYFLRKAAKPAPAERAPIDLSEIL